MPRRYVALDLETTGLDFDRDAIIEVGAVRFDPDGSCETFQTLVDPKRTIPYRIQRLTRITESDVAGAPLFADVASDLERFIGSDPIVGQNVSFDLTFLDRAGLRPQGPVFDTQELASLLLPQLLEQNLRAIAGHLKIEFPVQHRALADADAARQVFLALRQRLGALPPPLLDEAERLAAAIAWPLSHLVREVLDEQPALSPESTLVHDAVRPPQRHGSALHANAGEPSPVDADEIERLLTMNARSVVEGYEERPQQVQMARAVCDALNHGDELLVEAGTGIGKSLAYLLPAARYALDNETRVVVSTNTINLQGQLIGQDIPMVRQLLADGDKLQAAQLKGRRNYLCLLRWSNLRRSPSMTPDEARLLVRLLLWLPHTDTGDRAELRLTQGEESIWNRLSAQNEACLTAPCAFVKDGSCFLLRARRRAEAAHLLVVNHALVLSDVAVGGGVIPEYRHLVVDEGQHLEEEATSQFGFHAGEDDVSGVLDNIATRGAGVVTSLRGSVRGPLAQSAAGRELLDLAARAQDAADRARSLLPDFFLRLAGFIRQQTQSGGDYDDRLLLTRAMRVQPDWADVELAWENLSAVLRDTLSALQSVQTALQSPEAAALPDYESLLGEVTELLLTGETLRVGTGAIVLHDDPNTVAWLTYGGRSGAGAGLSSAPLRVAELLQDRLFSQKDSTVLTSATLTSEGRFDYLRETLGLSEAKELLLGSPFDYGSSTIVLVPQDMPDPNQPGYMAAVQQALIELVRASRGRALALFTSHSSLRAAHSGIKRALEEEQILVLGQNIDGSPRQLIQALRDHPHTLVLGAASFWEGVDVVGEALSLLIIARLPFSVPDDPIFQARSDLYDDPFNQYAVPQAVLRFKQGFGRLIRRKTDRGVMVMLDGRIHSKTYGQAFLRSLPSCAVHRVPVVQMPALVSQWLGDDETTPEDDR